MADDVSIPLGNKYTVSMGRREVGVDIIRPAQTVALGTRGPQGVPGLTRIADATDVDVYGVKNGDLLVFNGSNNKWMPTDQPSEALMDGGNF